jgi:hypothetical protein
MNFDPHRLLDLSTIIYGMIVIAGILLYIAYKMPSKSK